jgi:gamma-glutamyltranspeptidase / glutathione hydrolase
MLSATGEWASTPSLPASPHASVGAGPRGHARRSNKTNKIPRKLPRRSHALVYFWTVCLAVLIQLIEFCLLSASSEARAQLNPGTHAVVTANPAATSAAEKILSLGGSAIDAAIAAQLVLGVVEPQSSGIGGGAVLLYRELANGPVRAFDGLARSPDAYDPKAASAKGFSHSGAAVGVPGSVQLMEFLHERYGRLPWRTLFEPAIELAGDGFSVSPYLARSLAAAVRGGFTPPPWLRDGAGQPVGEGAQIRNETLASTMREIAQNGPTALYVGMASEIVSSIRGASVPGAMTESDLQNYKVVERAPLCTTYHQLRVCAFPPPSYGGVFLLEMLGLLDHLHASAPNFLNVSFVHAFIEAGRIAEADRSDVVGDPDVENVSVAGLLDQSYLGRRAKLVDPKQSVKDPVGAGAIDGPPKPTCLSAAIPPPPSTSQISIVDRWGAALSMTTTINVNFGAWLAVGGYFLNDAMTNFNCATNRPASNKRPETSMVPVIVADKAGRTLLVGGSAGGAEIVDYVAQAVLELINEMSPLAALDAGHVSTARSPYSESPGRVELEKGRAVASLADQLEHLGHDVKIVPLESGLGFLVWKNGVWTGAADPRRDGTWAAGR